MIMSGALTENKSTTASSETRTGEKLLISARIQQVPFEQRSSADVFWQSVRIKINFKYNGSEWGDNNGIGQERSGGRRSECDNCE